MPACLFVPPGCRGLCWTRRCSISRKGQGPIVERGVTVTGLAANPEEVRVEAGERRYTASAAVLATGKHNLRGWPRDPGTVTAFKMQFALTPAARTDLLRRVQLVLFEGGYIGASMVEGDVATICWQLDTDALQRIGADWRRQLDGISAHSARLGDLLVGARPVTPRAAAVSGLPFGYVRRSAIGERVYAIGDQLAVIPAFTGDGTSIALASGIRAARAFLAGESAGDFQKAFAQSLKRQFALAKAVSRLFRFGPTRRLAIGTMTLLPAVASRLAGATRLNLLARPTAS